MAVSEIEIRLAADIARLQQNMNEARRVVGGALGDIGSAARQAAGLIGGLAVGVAAVKFGSFVKNAIDAVDSLNDLSVRSKIAIEDLSGLALAAKLGDSSLEGIATSISKLAVNIGKDTDKFRALGVSATDPLEAFKQLSDIFKAIQDPQQRAAFGAEALGKSWQDAAVLLDAGSDGIAKLINRGKELSGVTAQSAADIGLFNDKIDELSFAAKGVGAQLATALLPQLDLLVDDLTATGKSAGDLQDKFAPITETFRALVILGGNVAFTFKSVGTEIGIIAAQIGQYYSALFKFYSLDFKGGLDTLKNTFGEGGIGDQATENAEKARAAFDVWEQSWLTVGTVAKEVKAELSEPFPDPFGIDAKLAEENAARVASFLKADEIVAARKKAAADAEAAAKKEQESYLGVISALREKAAANEAEIRTGIALTEAQKAIIKFDEEIKNGKLVLNAAHTAEAKALLETVSAQEKYLAAAKQTKEAVQQLADDRLSAFAAAQSEADANEKLVTEFGKTKAAIAALEVARLKERLAQRGTLELDADEVAQLERLIAAKERSAKATESVEGLEKIKKAAEDAAEEQKKFWSFIEDTAHSTFVSILDGSKNVAQRLKDTFKNIFFDWLYQQTIKKWIINVSGSLSGAGAAGAVQAAGGGASSGGSGILSALQGGKGIYDVLSKGFTSLASSISAGIAGLGNAVGSSSISAFGTGIGLSSSQASAAAAAYTQAGAQGTATALTSGAAAGAAITAAAGIAAGVLGGNLISGQFGSKGAVIGGTAAGGILGGIATLGSPIGIAIGSAIGGVLGGIGNRLFGMGDKKVTGQGVKGTFGADSFSGQSFQNWTQKGGLFRSNKSGTDTQALDSAVTQQLTDSYTAIKAVTTAFADALGAPTDVIKNFTKDINLALSGDATKDQQAFIDLLTSIGDELANKLVPNLSDFATKGETASATLQRVAGDFTVVQGVIDALGITSQQAFGEVGVASLAAREQLLKFAGGADALVAQVQFFSQNFLTAAEQLAPVQKQVTDQLAALGYSQLKTSDDFKNAVLGLASSGALATESGAKTYAALLALAPAFKAVTDAANAAQADALAQRGDLQKQLDALTLNAIQLQKQERDAIADSNKALYDQVQAAKAAKAAQDAAKGALEGAVSRTNSFVDSLKKLRSDLFGGSLSTATPQQKYEQARLDYDKAILEAKGGDVAAQSHLADLTNAFLEASKVVNASSTDYTADFTKVQQDTADALTWAKQQADLGQATLDAYNKGNGILTSIDANTIAVAEAIRALVAAGGFAQVNGSHASGLPVVPRDGYIARLHAGEGVVDAQSMGVMRRYFGGSAGAGSQGDGSEALIQVLREELDQLRTESRENTAALADAVYNANANAARTISQGAQTAAKESTWQRQSKQDANA